MLPTPLCVLPHPFMASLRTRNRLYVGGLGIMVTLFGLTPLMLKYRNEGHNLTTQDKPLTGSQIMRGAYLNTGSRDAGADPDWDNGKYIGAKKTPSNFNPSPEDLVEARKNFEAEKVKRGFVRE